MSAPVEAILAEIGKAFRLCRFYPATHPSVQQALAGVSSVLPDLAKVGAVELKIASSGFSIGAKSIAPRNPPVQELAGLLYTQGHRFLYMEPGLTVDEVGALIRAASSGAERAMRAVGGQPAFEQLPHIRLERSGRKAAAAATRPSGNSADAPVLGRRSMQVFRPDALPPDIETRRLATKLESGAGVDGPAAAARIGALVPELTAARDYKSLATGVRALGRAASGDDTTVASAAGRALDAVSDATIAGLVSRLGDATLPAAERDEVVQAVAALGARAIGLIADAYLVTSQEDEREILLAVVRRAGAMGAEAILARANPDARGAAARSQAVLLGATGAPSAALMLGAFAMHEEPEVRATAISGLARIQDPEAARFTMGGLRDADPRVRAAAALGLARFGDVSAGPIIMARLQEEADDLVAIALIGALGELCETRAVPVLGDTARGVSGVFQRHAASVRLAAIKALGAIPTGEARDMLTALADSRSAEVRDAAARALGT